MGTNLSLVDNLGLLLREATGDLDGLHIGEWVYDGGTDRSVSATMADQIQHRRVTYNGVHNLIRTTAPKISREFNPDLLIAIGGGGFFPARVLCTFLRAQTVNKTLQIQAIGLSLYKPIEGTNMRQIGNEVTRTQWLSNPGKQILGKRNLIIDEVDDTRKTLHYALSELKKDVEKELLSYPESQRAALRAATSFGIFVIHHKLRDKLAELPVGIAYFAGEEASGNVWLHYPWEATDIEEHDREAAACVRAARL